MKQPKIKVDLDEARVYVKNNHPEIYSCITELKAKIKKCDYQNISHNFISEYKNNFSSELTGIQDFASKKQEMIFSNYFQKFTSTPWQKLFLIKDDILDSPR
jgi:hypothetical protein